MLKTDRTSNILGGAALLAKLQETKSAALGEWFGAVGGRGSNGKLYKAVGGIAGGELFAEQCYLKEARHLNSKVLFDAPEGVSLS